MGFGLPCLAGLRLADAIFRTDIKTMDDTRSAKAEKSPNHISGLDGLRALSILIVMLSHAGARNWIPGAFGVTVFFFISGFLITTLLIRELRAKGRVDLLKFFIRRVLRLVPASTLFILAGIAVILAVGEKPKLSELGAAFFYLANYYQIFFHFSPVANTGLSAYNVLWSLAVEEHFYLLAAPVFVFLYARQPARYLMAVGAAIVVPLIVRAVFAVNHAEAIGDQIYTFAATECRLDSIAYGVFMAVVLQRHGLAARLDHWPLILLGGLLLIASFVIRDTIFRETLRYSVQGIGLSILVPVLIYGKKLEDVRAFLDLPFLVWVGQLSYSLYLFHWIAYLITTLWLGTDYFSLRWQSAFWVQTAAFALISYYGVEKQFFRLRSRFGSEVADAPKALPSPAQALVRQPE